jgi:transcriptional regulator with XRE-family HTH domain
MPNDDGDRGPNPVDIHVGQRIRARRKALGVSQERLAGELGLTFQQVQKYERGANRVSASKLWEIARALGADLSSFFEGLNAAPGVAEPGTPFNHDHDAQAPGPEGKELALLLPRLDRPRRRMLVELARTLAGDVSAENQDERVA